MAIGEGRLESFVVEKLREVKGKCYLGVDSVIKYWYLQTLTIWGLLHWGSISIGIASLDSFRLLQMTGG